MIYIEKRELWWRWCMSSKKTISILASISILVFSALACSLFDRLVSPQAQPEPEQPTAPVAEDTHTPAPEPTETMRPTWTPKPTITPDIAATQAYDELFGKVQQFANEGLIPTTEGKYIEVEDYRKDFAQIGWLNPTFLDFQVENFVYVGHVRWSTATSTSDVSGCGIIFAGQSDGRMYGTALDKSRIYFTSTDANYYYELGKTRGTGLLDLGNPAEVDLTVLVFENQTYVYVDNRFIGLYTLSRDKPLRGTFGYGIISGTNRDYGTRCEITNSRIWEISP
jgi:hypothetical protein